MRMDPFKPIGQLFFSCNICVLYLNNYLSLMYLILSMVTQIIGLKKVALKSIGQLFKVQYKYIYPYKVTH